MKISASEILVDIFQKIATFRSTWSCEGKTDPLDKMLEQLCANTPNCYPFGYHTDEKPNPLLCCDMPGCSLLDREEKWKRIDGCFHSFHLRCLKGVPFCPICRTHIDNVINTLGTAAQNAILNGEEFQTEDKECDDINDSIDQAVNSVKASEMENRMSNMSSKISEMKPCQPVVVRFLLFSLF